MANPEQNTRLVADIGGTNSRLALYDPVNAELRSRHDYLNSEHSRLEDIIDHWLQSLPEPKPREACLAVAAIPFDDQIVMFNTNWSFSCSELQSQFGFSQLRCINDFEGNAYALPHLRPEDTVTLHSGNAGASGKLATLGPGTGLGGSTFGLVAGMSVAHACEPGHMGLAPANALEIDLFSLLLKSHSDVYAELLLSGPGLKLLYHTIGQILDMPSEQLQPEEISARALAQDCALCSQTLNTFCGLLGSICGDFVLAQGAYGGVYLCGGILPRIIPILENSTFAQRFAAKGDMQDHLATVPLHVIISGNAGLLGAAQAPLN